VEDADHDDDGGGDGGEYDEALEVVVVVAERVALLGEGEGEVDPGDGGAGEAGAEAEKATTRTRREEEPWGEKPWVERRARAPAVAAVRKGPPSRLQFALRSTLIAGLIITPRLAVVWPMNYSRGPGNGSAAMRMLVN
jgi:hypothetical protein